MRSRVTQIVLLTVCVAFFSLTFHAYGEIAAKDAQKYLGKTETVCGQVASATHAVRIKGQPTFLNLDEPYPNQIFTVVIWGSDRVKFQESPEKFYRGKTICITGKITSYRGKPQIVVKDPKQIVVK
jgi:hypothetical protein